jgi:hypothetical protein
MRAAVGHSTATAGIGGAIVCRLLATLPGRHVALFPSERQEL